MSSPRTSDSEPVLIDRSRLRCFIIGPIGSQLAERGTPERQNYEDALQVLSEVILPACDAVGLEAVRADGLARAGEITEQIFRRLRDDDVIIADLTGANPNVMYELGMRHTRDLLTIQIGEYGRLPFDVSSIRTVQFSRSAYGLIQARDELIQVLESGLADQYDPVMATRVWNDDSEPLPPTSTDGPPSSTEPGPTPGTAAGLDDAPGFLDLVAAGEDASERFTEVSLAVATLIRELTTMIGHATDETHKSDSRNGGMAGRLRVAAGHAQNLDSIAPRLERAVEDYKRVLETVVAGWGAMIGQIETDRDQVASNLDFLINLRSLAQLSRESVESNRAMAQSLVEGAKAARVLRPPTRRIVDQMDQFAEATGKIDEIDRRLQALGVPPAPDDWAARLEAQGGEDQADGETTG